MTQAAFDGARAARGLKQDGETAALKRIVFDEGHHLFDAADSAFSACLSGQEAAELRRWIRGPEGRGRRGRGWSSGSAIWSATTRVRRRRCRMPSAPPPPCRARAWSGRIAPPDGRGQSDRPDRTVPDGGAGADARPNLRGRLFGQFGVRYGMRRPAGDRAPAGDRPGARAGPSPRSRRRCWPWPGIWKTSSTRNRPSSNPRPNGPGSRARCAAWTVAPA
jgi:hypothetical protein